MDAERPAAGRPRKEWYASGLRFTCEAGCGLCCTGAPGFVWVTAEEIADIAARLGLPVQQALLMVSPEEKVTLRVYCRF